MLPSLIDPSPGSTSHAHYWTFTSEAWGDPSYVGVYLPNYGEITESGPEAFPLTAAFTDNTGHFRVVLQGDRMAAVQDADFSCSDGSRLAVADADAFEFYNNGHTRIFWQSSGVAFSDGQEVSCSFIMPE